LVVSGAATPAGAFSGAFFPTQSVGNRGTDVAAIQYLLRNRGLVVRIDSVFSAATQTAVRSFQERYGIPVDGIVAPPTWAKLIVLLKSGSTGDAVRAVQHQLNQKRSARLHVDGTFGTMTVSAVVAFQRHAGLVADGVMNSATWRNLIWHYEYANFAPASLCDYTDTTGNGTKANWGTAAAIGQMEAAAAAGYRAGTGAIGVGDISLEHGGNIAGHTFHERGLEVDLRPIRRDRLQCRWGTSWRWTSYDRTATRVLVRALRAAAPGHLRLIYFNDPILIREGLTRWYTGHDGHLHVRYCEKTHPDPIYDC
jgi:peptidoglycan hydrolase-like protein with peptidoglycan-binding domain